MALRPTHATAILPRSPSTSANDAGDCHLTLPNRPEPSGNEVAATACLSGLGEQSESANEPAERD